MKLLGINSDGVCRQKKQDAISSWPHKWKSLVDSCRKRWFFFLNLSKQTESVKKEMMFLSDRMCADKILGYLELALDGNFFAHRAFDEPWI